MQSLCFIIFVNSLLTIFTVGWECGSGTIILPGVEVLGGKGGSGAIILHGVEVMGGKRGGGYYSACCGCGECLPNMICMSDDC